MGILEAMGVSVRVGILMSVVAVLCSRRVYSLRYVSLCSCTVVQCSVEQLYA